MVAQSWTAVDVDGAVREWVRSLGLTSFFGVNNDAGFPQVVPMRIVGTDLDCLFQFDVWGDTKKSAADTAATLASGFSDLHYYAHEGVLLHAATWTSTRWLPDEQTDKPRYIVEATFTASTT